MALLIKRALQYPTEFFKTLFFINKNKALVSSEILAWPLRIGSLKDKCAAQNISLRHINENKPRGLSAR